jgi:N-methylhydantoinase A
MRVAFDIGGTFTDVVVLYGSGQIRTAKILSDLELIGGEIVKLVDGGDEGEDVSSLIHATTVCSNAIVEGKVPPVAFITTKGFRHVLSLMASKGPVIADIEWERPPPLIPIKLCFEVDERILADGTVSEDIKEDQLQDVISRVLSENVEAIAVSLINSFKCGRHEEIVRNVIATRAPYMPVSISSEVDAEIKEYDRASTTVINALLLPVVRRYLDRLQIDLQPLNSDVRIMQSNGGTMSSTVARQRPMTMVDSGPAAGVLAAAHLAKALHLESVLSFDMGGTTAKVCLIENGTPVEKLSMEIGSSLSAGRLRGYGYPLRAPTLDIVEVGAGGGSIAWIDGVGALRVGPASAGAIPGPVCYQRGGAAPTVTDANVALGYIDPSGVGDFALPLDKDAASAAIGSEIGDVLHLDVLETAQGVIDVANATMMRALRAVSTERGRDIRKLTLIVFGGCGPLHATHLCDLVGISEIVVPPVAGVFSAMGLLLAGDRLDYVYSFERPVADVTERELLAAHESMLRDAAADAGRSGFDNLQASCSVDLRYKFEPNTLTVEVGPIGSLDYASLGTAFQSVHAVEYGFPGTGEIYLSRLRLRATSPDNRLSFADFGRRTGDSLRPQLQGRTRSAYFGRRVGLTPTPVLARSEITERVEGPVIIEDPTTTTVVSPGWTVQSNEMDCLVIGRD